MPDDLLESLYYRLTFIPEEEILQIIAKQAESPEQNIGKKRLAKEIISYITGSSTKADSVSNYSKYFTLDFSLLVFLQLIIRRRKPLIS